MTAPTAAASVVLARSSGSPECFVVRRADNLRFLGGFTAFPGGKVASEDAFLAQATRGADVRQVAAIRELFEETGVLLARRSDGSFPSSELLTRPRTELLANRQRFDQVLGALDLHLHIAGLTEVGSVVTPPFSTLRFDTTFYIAEQPPGQEATVWPGELSAGAWQTAAAVLTSWKGGDILLSPPALLLLEAIADLPIAELPARTRPFFRRLEQGILPPIFFSPDVRALPLRSEALPPAAYTNVYLVGSGPRYLIDPGPVDPAEQQALFTLLDEEKAAGRPVEAILLTHHHPDHIGAAAECAGRYGLPVWAHAATAVLVQARVKVTRTIQEGDSFDLGPAPHGRGRWRLHTLFTPGHAPGHLAFWEPDYGLLFVGDLVSTLSTVIVAPPDGDLIDYLASISRIRTLPCRLLLPAHGSPSSRAGHVLTGVLEHRAIREQQLRDALRGGVQTVAELAPIIYRGLPDPLMKYAEGQIRAGLQKLEKEEVVESIGPEAWRVR